MLVQYADSVVKKSFRITRTCEELMHLKIIFLARTKPYRYSAKSLKSSGQQKFRECADNSAIYTDDSKFDTGVGSGI